MENLNAILPIDKEVDITSYDVIRRLKKYFPRKYKIGHAGTLDPFATGLLLILIGRKATKKSNELMGMKKTYEFKVQLGYETDTLDTEGEKTDEQEVSSVTEVRLKEAIETDFLGDIEQDTPKYSAKKIGGKKAYELARAGKDFKIPKRQVTVYDYKILNTSDDSFELEATVSKGTYIRVLARDIARALGNLGTAIQLRRTQVGEYNVEHALNSKDITEENILKFGNVVS